ncbi:MAG TPA: hypothetical protein VE135_21555 [Pyrinomonadaceae bacterium]|nr:hypothetical protein [Pyrinomonadaceae bacterium]
MPLSRKTALSLIRPQQRDEPEAHLLPWIAKGDEAAFRLFFEATNGLLFGLLLRILGHTQTAEDVLSELYEEVRQKAARFGKQNERPLTLNIIKFQVSSFQVFKFQVSSSEVEVTKPKP